MEAIPCERLPLFDGIGKNDISSLLTCLKSRVCDYRKGEYILLDQEQVQYVGVVLSGCVHMMREDAAGHRTLIAYMEPGELIGETFAFLKETQSSVSLLAAQDTRVLFLSLEYLLRPCRADCPFHLRLAQNVFRAFNERNEQLIEKIEISSKATLRDKILAYLTLQAKKQGSKYITVPLNRTEMANFLQSNRSAMTRELTDMKTAGLIDFDGDTFVLKS